MNSISEFMRDMKGKFCLQKLLAQKMLQGSKKTRRQKNINNF